MWERYSSYSWTLSFSYALPEKDRWKRNIDEDGCCFESSTEVVVQPAVALRHSELDQHQKVKVLLIDRSRVVAAALLVVS